MAVTLPTVGGSSGTWGTIVNAAFDEILNAARTAVEYPLYDRGGKEYNLKRWIGNNGWDGSTGTDVTGAFNYALDEIQPLGPARIVIPGDIDFKTAAPSDGGGHFWGIMPLYDDLEIVGAHRSVKVHLTGDLQFIWVAGAAKADRVKTAGNGFDWYHHSWFGANADEEEYPRLTVMPVTATVPKHAMSITLVNQADADSIAVDDYITIVTGQTYTGGATTNNQPDAEVLRVKSKSGTGNKTLNLWWPTATSYAQEYYISGTMGETSTSVTANAAPFGVQRVEDNILKNIRLANFTLIKHTYSGNASFGINGGWTAGLTIEDIDYYSYAGAGFEGVGLGNIGKTVRNCRLFIQNTQNLWQMACDTGGSYFRFLDNQIYIDGPTNVFHINEGSKRAIISRNQVIGPEWTGATRQIAIQGRGYEIQVLDNQLSGGSTNDADIFVDELVKGGGQIRGNTHAKSGGSSIIVADGAEGFDVTPQRGTTLGVSVPTPNALPDRRIFIPAKDFHEVTAAVATFDETSGSYPRWSCPTNVLAQLVAGFMQPDDWQSWNAYVHWTNLGTGTGNVYWAFNAAGTADGESLATYEVDTGSGPVAASGQNVLVVTKVTSSPATAGAVGELMYANVVALRSDAGDTLADAVGFYGLELRRVS